MCSATPPRAVTAAAAAGVTAVVRSCDACISDTTIQHRVGLHSHSRVPLPPRLALGMADGERSPLLSDLGDGALGSGNGGVSPGGAPYVPNKPHSEYPWSSLLHLTPACASLTLASPLTQP